MEIREAMKIIEGELGKRVPIKAEWKSQLPPLLQTYQDISFPDAIIEEEWNSRFMPKVSELSQKYADKLQGKFGTYQKSYTNGRVAYELNLWQAPPTRILAMTTILMAWLGWILVTHNHPISLEQAKRQLEEAFREGKNIGQAGNIP